MKHLKNLLLAFALVAGQSWAAFTLAVSVPAGGTTNVDVRAPALILAIPNQTTNPGQTVTMDLGHYLDCAPYFGSPVNNCVWSWVTAPTSPSTSSINANGVATMSMAQSQAGLQLRVTSSYGGGTTVLSNVFNWTVTGSGGGQIAATGFFVDCAAGSDSAAGNAQTAPWRTLAKVNTTVVTPAVDVWIKSGSPCINQTLTIDWSGIATGTGGSTVITDPVTVGAYYVQGGVAYQAREIHNSDDINPADPTWSYGANPRAIIQGPVNDGCRNAVQQSTTHCPYAYGGTNVAGAVPSNMASGLVVVQARYATVQDLDIRGSSGNGIVVQPVTLAGNCQGAQACAVFATIQRNKIDRAMTGAINAGYLSYLAIRQNETNLTNLEWGDRPCCPTVTNVGAPITVVGSHVLIENNYVHDDYGDGIGGYARWLLVRGNRMAAVGRSYVYLGAGFADAVAEQNEFFDGNINDPIHPGSGTGNGFQTMGMAQEGFASPSIFYDARVIFRGNLASKTAGSCIADSIYQVFVGQGPPSPYNLRASRKVIGNTCIQTGSGNLLDMSYLNVTAFLDSLEVANNLLKGSNPGFSEPTMAQASYHHNQFTTTPGDIDLRTPGTGDVYNANTGLGSFNFSTVTSSSMPTYTVFLTSGGAGATAASLAEYNETGFLDNTGNPWNWILGERRMISPCPPGVGAATMPTLSQFLANSAYDYCSNLRDTTIGGLD